jgi:ATP-binding cassette, subfamily B, bacterial
MKEEKVEEKKHVHPIVSTFKTEWAYLGKKRKLFVFYISLFVFAGLVSLLTPYVIGTIFNSIQESITSKAQLGSLIFKFILLLIITVVFWALHGPARVMETLTGFNVKKNYVNDKIRIVLKLPVKWHKDNHSGDTIDKINRASNSLQDFAGEKTYQIVYAIISLFGSLTILFFINWKIALFALLSAVIILLVISKVDNKLHKKYIELNAYNNKLSATIFDYISNILTVITLRLRKTVSEEIEEKQAVSYKAFKSVTIINEMKWGFATIAIQIMVVAALIYKAYSDFNLAGTILVGTLYMVYGYLNNVGETFYRFAEIYGNIIYSNAKIVNVDPIDEEYRKLEYPAEGRLPKGWKNIAFKDISFTYDLKGKRNHLQDINFSLKKKQKIALVGESGSGKSTILSLIRGLYKIEKGDIFCDNQILEGGINNIKDQVTLIPQEPEIFNNTFRYNITMNLPATDAEINKVIEISQLRNVIDKLPNGLDTNVKEKGVSLSGGEKQRLALARGLLAARKSEIVLMDEPTSSVDSLNEMKIHEQVFDEFRNKTIVSSIHRLHLLDKFDNIYLFSDGKIVGQGTFEELKTNPVFSRMWRRYNREKLLDKELEKKK